MSLIHVSRNPLPLAYTLRVARARGLFIEWWGSRLGRFPGVLPTLQCPALKRESVPDEPKRKPTTKKKENGKQRSTWRDRLILFGLRTLCVDGSSVPRRLRIRSYCSEESGT